MNLRVDKGAAIGLICGQLVVYAYYAVMGAGALQIISYSLGIEIAVLCWIGLRYYKWCKLQRSSSPNRVAGHREEIDRPNEHFRRDLRGLDQNPLDRTDDNEYLRAVSLSPSRSSSVSVSSFTTVVPPPIIPGHHQSAVMNIKKEDEEEEVISTIRKIRV